MLTPDDIAGMAKHLRLDEAAFVGRYTVLASNRAQLSLAERDNGDCIFLEGSDCVVYASRPAQCRAFPAGWSVPGCPAFPRDE